MTMANDPGVAQIRLDRADRGNALDAAQVLQLREAVARAVADPQVHTLALTGAGKHFCTGFDLSDLETTTDAELLARFVQVELLLQDIWNAPVRTLAVAHGRTWGAGADLFTACDRRLCTGDAQFRFPGAGFGLVLGTRRLATRVGRDLARRLTCDGEALSAEAALRAGLVTEIVAGDIDLRVEAPPVARDTVAALRRATADTDSDADLAALVRSAAAPGLRDRVAAYRARSLAAARRD